MGVVRKEEDNGNNHPETGRRNNRHARQLLAHPPLNQDSHFPLWILDRELRIPKTLRSHKITGLTTMAFKIELMEPANGMKRC